MSSPYKTTILLIHWIDSNHIWVLISPLVLVWSYEFWSIIDLLVDIKEKMQQTPNYNYYQLHQIQFYLKTTIRSKDPLVEGCIKQRCGRGYLELSDLIHNDCSLVNFELFLVKIVMYLLIFIYDVDVVCLFINESGIIKKNVNTKRVLRLKN